MLALGDDRVKVAIGPGDGSRAAVRAPRARRVAAQIKASPVPDRHAVGGFVCEVAMGALQEVTVAKADHLGGDQPQTRKHLRPSGTWRSEQRRRS